uniref:TORC_C domain-containing protein n=1 Tax=Steinernema glaseri TaxID=37863 RepID=A0A1I7XY41_9BILA
GLLESQQQSPQFVQSPVHAQQQQMGMYQDPQQQQFLRTPMMNQPYHSRHVSSDAVLDQSMEVDYSNYPMHPLSMQQQQQLPTIEPIMRDLGMGGLNPQEFDKYLRIDDSHQRAANSPSSPPNCQLFVQKSPAPLLTECPLLYQFPPTIFANSPKHALSKSSRA